MDRPVPLWRPSLPSSGCGEIMTSTEWAPLTLPHPVHFGDGGAECPMRTCCANVHCGQSFHCPLRANVLCICPLRAKYSHVRIPIVICILLGLVFALLAFCKCIQFAIYCLHRCWYQSPEESKDITGHSSSLTVCLQLQLPAQCGISSLSSV